MSDSLKKLTHQYFDQQTLRQGKLEQLLDERELLENSFPQVIHTKWRHFSMAASVVCIIFIYQFFYANGSLLSSGVLIERVTQEVAMNHNKDMPINFIGDRLAIVRQQMDRLDFTLKDSTRSQLEGLSLVGGRYCSIQGNIAAQLKLSNANEKTYTLYQTRLSSELSRLPSSVQISQGVIVSSWQEDDIYFSLAVSQ